jgi:hypothetical protein
VKIFSRVRKSIIDKNGKRTTVYINPHKEAKSLPPEPPSPSTAVEPRHQPIHSFSFSDEEVVAFTESDCFLLAEHIQAATGWERVAIGTEWGEDGKLDLPADYDWVHMVNRMPDGKLVDITGIYDKETLMDKWLSDLHYDSSISHPSMRLVDDEGYMVNAWSRNIIDPAPRAKAIIELVRGIEGV